MKKKSQEKQEQKNRVKFVSNGTNKDLTSGVYMLEEAHAQRLVDKKFGTIEPE
jgi:hypothetical protein